MCSASTKENEENWTSSTIFICFDKFTPVASNFFSWIYSDNNNVKLLKNQSLAAQRLSFNIQLQFTFPFFLRRFPLRLTFYSVLFFFAFPLIWIWYQRHSDWQTYRTRFNHLLFRVSARFVFCFSTCRRWQSRLLHNHFYSILKSASVILFIVGIEQKLFSTLLAVTQCNRNWERKRDESNRFEVVELHRIQNENVNISVCIDDMFIISH